MERRDVFRLGGNLALSGALFACGGGGTISVAQSMSSARKWVTTRDGVKLSVVDIGDTSKPALLFVHGLSQSAFSWGAQFASSVLRERYRLVAVDLRGHGMSQGAFNAVDSDGMELPLLPTAKYSVESESGTSALWANDIDAVIQGLGLNAPILIGWSYGAVVALDYMRTQGGLGALSKVFLTGGTPVLLPPGAPTGGGDVVFGSAVPAAVFKTLDNNLLLPTPAPSTISDVISGMAEFVQLALLDTVPGRAKVGRDDVVRATTFNLQMPPVARQAAVLRNFDFRPFVTSLPASTRRQIRVVSGASDAVIQSAVTRSYYQSTGLDVVTLANEGHLWFLRNPSLFATQLQSLTASA